MTKEAGQREAARRGWRAEPPTTEPTQKPTPHDPVVEALANTIRAAAARPVPDPEPEPLWPDTGQGRGSPVITRNPGLVEAEKRFGTASDLTDEDDN